MTPLVRTSFRRFSSVSVATPQLQTEQLVEHYLARPNRCLKLSTLVSFGQPLTSESLLLSVNYATDEIPRRLATRVRSFEDLPFIVGMNPFVSRLREAHESSFYRLATYPPPSNLQKNTEFTTELEKLVNAHANDIPQMAKGLQECSRYMSPEETSSFLNGEIRNRIAVRLIAEQHIALSHALEDPKWREGHIGIIDLKCRPRELIWTCNSFVAELCAATLGSSPTIVVDGDVDATFAYVPVHVEYILTEILKNAFRATVENHHKLHGYSTTKDLPPIVITISSAPPSSNSNSPSSLSLRIRDQGGGVSRANMARIFSYAFTTAEYDSTNDGDEGGPYAAQQVGGSAAIDGADGEGNLFGEITRKGIQTGLGTFYGLGYGLPMSRLYAQYFGGSLDFLSLDGWGSDVFLKLPSLDVAGDVQI